jgi:hypothetical protein
VGTKRAPKNAPFDRQKTVANGGSARPFPQKRGLLKMKILRKNA